MGISPPQNVGKREHNSCLCAAIEWSSRGWSQGEAGYKHCLADIPHFSSEISTPARERPSLWLQSFPITSEMMFYAQPSEEPGCEKPFPEGVQWRMGVQNREPGRCRDLQSWEGFASRFRAFSQVCPPGDVPTNLQIPMEAPIPNRWIFLGVQGMGSWVFLEGWAEFALLLLTWFMMTHFECPGSYRCEPEHTLHLSFCCSGSQPCCSFLISQIPQCCFSHSHCKTFAVFPWFAVKTVLKQLLAGLGQLLPKLNREFCCLKWLVTFSFHFHNSSTSVSFNSTLRKTRNWQFAYNNIHKLPRKTKTEKSSTELYLLAFTWHG